MPCCRCRWSSTSRISTRSPGLRCARCSQIRRSRAPCCRAARRPTRMRRTAPVAPCFYANLTQALTAKCNLLLALWDGHTSRLEGGTADTVLRYLGARTPSRPRRVGPIEFQAAAQPKRLVGPHFVYWMPTPRLDGSSRSPRSAGLSDRHRREPARGCMAPNAARAGAAVHRVEHLQPRVRAAAAASMPSSGSTACCRCSARSTRAPIAKISQRSTRSTAKPMRSRSTTSGIPIACSAASATRRRAWRCCS